VVPAFGRWMARAGGDLLAEADVLVPVLLHWKRLFARRYNQAAMLAQSIARLSGVAVTPGLLRRRWRIPSQGRFSLAAPRCNVRGAFALAPVVARIKSCRVLLIDDVLTLARVPRPGF